MRLEDQKTALHHAGRFLFFVGWDVVGFESLKQGPAGDAELFGHVGFVAVAAFESILDHVAFYCFNGIFECAVSAIGRGGGSWLQFFGEHVESNWVAIRCEDKGAFDFVFEFAYVSGPVIAG